MFEIGGSLTAARQAQGLELPDVEKLTCIRVKQLAALEAEDFGALPGRAYARAFLRTYALVLALDPEPFVSAFEERFPRPEDELPPRPPREPRAFPTRASLTATAVVAVVAFVAWSGMTTNKPSSPLPSLSASRATAPAHPPDAVARLSRPSAPAALVIRAVRGDCWLLARRGGATGPVLYEATLQQGQVIRLTAPRIWVRFGAPWNVDVSRAGRAIHGLSVTHPVNLVT